MSGPRHRGDKFCRSLSRKKCSQRGSEPKWAPTPRHREIGRPLNSNRGRARMDGKPDGEAAALFGHTLDVQLPAMGQYKVMSDAQPQPHALGKPFFALAAIKRLKDPLLF